MLGSNKKGGTLYLQPDRDPMLSLHLRIAVLALLPLLIWGSYRALSAEQAQLIQTPVEIGVEHQGPSGVSITHSIGGNTHLVDIGNDSNQTIHVSVPDMWERGEVRGTSLSSIVVEAPSFGFRRWSIPAGATVTYLTPNDFTELAVHHPTRELLKVTLTTVNLKRNDTNTEVYLLQDSRLDLSV